MADKAQIIAKIKRNLLLTEVLKERLLQAVEIADEKQLGHVLELLNKDKEVIKKIKNKIY